MATRPCKFSLNAGEATVIEFPGGETVVRVDSARHLPDIVTITGSIESGNDLLELAQLVDVVRYNKPIDMLLLHAPFIMSSRQDRRCNEGEAFSAQVVTRMINALEFDRVFTFMPHSGVLPALLNNCVPDENMCWLMQDDSIMDLVGDHSLVHVVAPDAGASKWVFSNAYEIQQNRSFGKTWNFVQGTKKRSTEDGRLFDIDVECEDFQGAPVIVTDDLCANGGTFLGLHKVIRERNAGPVFLVLGHADHQQGLLNCSREYDRVVVSNSRSGIETDEAQGILVREYNR